MGLCLAKCLAPCAYKKAQDVLSSTATSLFDLEAVDIDGNTCSLADVCSGKKCILVVNVASK